MGLVTETIEGVMGTRVAVGAAHPLGPIAARAVGRAIGELRRLEKVFSVFDPDSELCRYRAGAGAPSAELEAVLRSAERWQLRTSGAFNTRVDRIRDLWAEAAEAGRIPTKGEVGAAVEAVTAAEESGDPSGTNLNAIAKGWSVDRALDAALDAGLGRAPTRVWINAGGDIAHRGRGSMAVGIEDPAQPYDNAAPLAQVEIANSALATSGDARRFTVIEGRRFGHVIDPRTGWPVDHIAQASVLAPSAEVADVLATAATVLRPDETLAMVAELAGVAVLLIDAHGNAKASPGWPDSS